MSTKASPATPKLTHVLNLRAYMSKEGAISGKHRGGGVRHLAPLTGGYLKGIDGSRAEGLCVNLMPGGSDWLIVDEAQGMAYLDVRTHGTEEYTKNGFYIHYTGYLGLDEVAAAFQSWVPGNQSSKGGDHHWWTNPTFETGSDKFSWMNTTLFVGRGHWWAGDNGMQAVEYEIFEVSH